jgi:fumarate reductase flavoprotein subunit
MFALGFTGAEKLRQTGRKAGRKAGRKGFFGISLNLRRRNMERDTQYQVVGEGGGTLEGLETLKVEGDVFDEDAPASGLSRRSFVAGMAAVGAVAVASGVAGCTDSGSGGGGNAGGGGTGGGGAAGGDSSVREANMTPGTYVGEAEGHRGKLKVSVTVSENRIEQIEFLESIPRTNDVIPPLSVDFFAIYAMAMLDDAPQILKTVTDRLGERIVEHQSLMVDTICGATFTAHGYLNAVKAALEQAGGTISAFDVEIPKKEDTQTYDGFDVIVVGGGASGTTAAASATANGAKVLLIEKSARIGGCGSMSSGIHCVNSEFQKAAGFEFDNSTYFPDVMKQGLWYPKATIVKQFLDQGGKVADFLLDKGGFDFRPMPDGVGYAQDSILAPNASESWYRVAGTVDTVLLETRVTGLIIDGTGTVTGVEAESFDGTKITANAKAVIIATGGFMNNPELMEKHNRFYFSTGFSMMQDVGEGLEMMLGAGAQEYHIGGMNIHITQPSGEIKGFDDYAAMIPYTLHAAPNILRVNDRGERFSSETILKENMVGNGNYLASQGRYFYSIVSKDQMDVLATEGLAGAGLTEPVFCVNFNFYVDPIDYKMEQIKAVLDAGVEAGFVFKGDTLDSLAAAAGFKAAHLKAHVARYDAACAAGYDDLYYKDPALLFPLGNGPYYAIQSECCPYSTMGGVEVDEQMRVLDAQGDPIGGLYAAGCETIGALYGGAAYSDLGGFPFGWATYSGFATGASAAGKPLA